MQLTVTKPSHDASRLLSRGRALALRAPRTTRRAVPTCAVLVCVSCAAVQAQVATPTLSPASSLVLPVSVTVSTVTAGASIYYTVDGTVPDTNDTLYFAPIQVTNDTVLRARAFKLGLTPSDTAFAQYPSVYPPALNYSRVVTNPISSVADVSLFLTHESNAVCHTVEERWTGDLTPTNITGGGVWLTNRHAIRWGPFLHVTNQQFSYRLSGRPGRHLVSGEAVADGRWFYASAVTNVDLSETNGPSMIPMPPLQAATPVFSPSSGAIVPVLATIASATGGAEIRYTLDGSLPSAASALYTNGLSLASETLIRARAFRTNYLPSIVAWALYPAVDTNPVARVSRSVNTNTPGLPLINVTITQTVAGSCLAYEEYLPAGISPTNISGDGLYNSTNRIIKWGSYLGGGTVRTMAYTAICALPGVYNVSGRWSVDGRGSESTGLSFAVTSTNCDDVIPTPPPRAPMPSLSPSGSTGLPVTVSMSVALSGATIRYTTDGSVPGTTSPVYGSALNLVTSTIVRARAYMTGYEPSAAVVGLYEQCSAAHGLTLSRAITNNSTYFPSVRITATPSPNVSCYAVTETLADGLMPYNIGEAGLWNPTNHTIKWGPFLDATPRVLPYSVSGPSGIYELTGQGGVDGEGVVVTGEHTMIVSLAPMPKVETPVISPPPSGVFPVTVTITTATEGATIRYTTDCSVPDTNSPIYTTPLHFDTMVWVKARAFKDWMTPSWVAAVLYGEETPSIGSQVTRTIFNNQSAHPRVELAVTAATGVLCQAVVEDLPVGVAPDGITAGGVFQAGSRSIKWGPFFDDEERVLSVSGLGIGRRAYLGRGRQFRWVPGSDPGRHRVGHLQPDGFQCGPVERLEFFAVCRVGRSADRSSGLLCRRVLFAGGSYPREHQSGRPVECCHAHGKVGPVS